MPLWSRVLIIGENVNVGRHALLPCHLTRPGHCVSAYRLGFSGAEASKINALQPPQDDAEARCVEPRAFGAVYLHDVATRLSKRRAFVVT